MTSKVEFKKELLSCLSSRWTAVAEMDINAARTLLQSFVVSCVSERFEKSFYRNFSGPKPLTDRFFLDFSYCSLKDRLEYVFRTTSVEEVSVKLLLCSTKTPIAYGLRGNKRTVKDIFVADEDSIAEVAVGRRVGFLMFEEQRGTLRSFRRA